MIPGGITAGSLPPGCWPDGSGPGWGSDSRACSLVTGERRKDNVVGKKAEPDYEVIVLGAGVCGIYQLWKLQELGVSSTVLEAGSDLGGTWYWNRYPGARFDSESVSYGYSFSKELLEEWNWSEHFAPQPETLRYLNLVADKFDLRRDIQFRARVAGARWDEASR